MIEKIKKEIREDKNDSTLAKAWGSFVATVLLIPILKISMRFYPISIRVLGFPNSGKTQFLNALRGIKNGEKKVQTVGIQDVPEFVFFCDGIKLIIKAKDINGSREFLIKATKTFTEESNRLYFLLDIVSYLKNKNNCRIEVQRVLNAIYIFASQRSVPPGVAVILTHADRLNEIHFTREQAINEFKKSISDRPYHTFPCYSVNTNNQEETRKLFEEIII